MQAKPKFRVSNVLRWLIPLLISAAAVFLIMRQVDLKAVAAAFRQISFKTLAFSVLLLLAGLFLRAASCYVIMDGKFSFKTIFYGMNAGYLLNNVLPFRLGEFGRAALLAGRGKSEVGFMEALAGIFTERILDLLLGAVFFLLTLPLVVQSSLNNLAIVMLLLTVIAMGAAAFGSRKKEQISAYLARKWAGKAFLRDKVLPKLNGFLDGFSLLLKPGKFILALFLLAASWALSMLILLLISQELFIGSQWWWGAFVVSASAFAAALPSAPASLGVLEAANVAAFSLLGVNQSSALVVALVMHALNFTLTSLLGMLGVYVLGESFSGLIRRVSQRRNDETEG